MSAGTYDKTGSCGESEALIAAFQSGEKDAFDRLVLKYQNRVFNLCYRFVGNYEDANDCAQAAFVKAYRALKKFRFDSSFSTWLYRIAVNTCKNRLKSSEYRYSRKMVQLVNSSSAKEDCSVEIGDESLSPVTMLERKESGIIIQEAIDSLPEDQKEVVILRDIEGLSYEEIARVSGQSPGTVKSRLARAREKLREKLTGVM